MATTNFVAYFDESIKEWISNEEEQKLVENIMLMDYGQLQELKVDVNTEAALDPNYVHSREGVLTMKSVIRRVHTLKKAGKWKPKMTLGSVAQFAHDFMLESIIIDEFLKRR